MAWTYFTAPLADGDWLTAAQMAEILDAVEERLAFYGGGIVGLTEAKNSRLAIGRLRYTAELGGSEGLDEIPTILEALSLRYAVSDTDPNTFSYGDLRVAYLAEIGMDNADWVELLASRLASAKYWNAVRAALNFLIYPTVGFNPIPTSGSGSVQYYQKALNASSWAAVLSGWPTSGAYIGEGEGPQTAYSRSYYYSASDYAADSIKTTCENAVQIPSNNFTLLGTDAWVFIEAGFGYYPPSNDHIKATLGSVSGVSPTFVANGPYRVPIAGVTDGLKDFTLELASYDDTANLSGYEPNSTDTIKSLYLTGATRLYFAPAFAKQD